MGNKEHSHVLDNRCTCGYERVANEAIKSYGGGRAAEDSDKLSRIVLGKPLRDVSFAEEGKQ